MRKPLNLAYCRRQAAPRGGPPPHHNVNPRVRVRVRVVLTTHPAAHIGPACKGIGTSSTNTGQGRAAAKPKETLCQGRIKHVKSADLDGAGGGHMHGGAAAGQPRPGAMAAAGQGKESHSQGETERYWFVSSRFRVSRHGDHECRTRPDAKAEGLGE